MSKTWTWTSFQKTGGPTFMEMYKYLLSMVLHHHVKVQDPLLHSASMITKESSSNIHIDHGLHSDLTQPVLCFLYVLTSHFSLLHNIWCCWPGFIFLLFPSASMRLSPDYVMFWTCCIMSILSGLEWPLEAQTLTLVFRNTTLPGFASTAV